MDTNKKSEYLHEVALYCHTSQELIEHLVASGILAEDEIFSSEDIRLISRAARLQRDFGVNDEGVDIILYMRSQLKKLQAELANMRRYYRQFDDFFDDDSPTIDVEG